MHRRQNLPWATLRYPKILAPWILPSLKEECFGLDLKLLRNQLPTYEEHRVYNRMYAEASLRFQTSSASSTP